MADDVRIPKDREARRRLYDFAGLTEDERRAMDQWCSEQAVEDEARRRRGMEANGERPMP